jgi:diacylglycerol kinase (ATP)
VRWTAIVNPVAGRRRARRTRPALAAALADRRIPVCYPDGPTAAAEAAAARFADGEGVLVCGGDGTVARLAGVAAGSGGTIGIVPTGTGNDFARHLGIDGHRPLEALALLESGRIASCDLGRVTAADGTTAWFTTVANTGFDADANRWANGVRWASGTMLYVLAMLRTLATYRPAGVEVVVDGRAHAERAWLVAVANSRYYAGGMMIAPGAEVDDGQLDVCLVGPVSRGEFLARFPRVFRGTHTRLETVRTWRGATVELRATSPADALECWASGERVGPLPATLTAVPAALRVLVPAGAPVTGR